MDQERIEELRAHTTGLYERGRAWIARVPATAKIMLGLFLIAAVLLALYTGLSSKNASLHLKLQHGFHSADLSVWIDGDLTYSGKLRGSLKKKFGLIPDSVQGGFSQSIPVRSGTHKVRVQVASEDGSHEGSISGDFARNTERDLAVSARSGGLSLAWQATRTTAPPAGPDWFTRYAGTLLLTVAGSIISALTGFAIRELPGRIRSGSSVEPRA